MPRTRPPYPPEFRREAVRMVRSSGRPISEAARELGVSAESLRKWVKQTEVDAATREEIASIRAESGGDGGGELSAPLGRLKSGRLVFANGTLRLNLRAAAGMADLYRASFEGPAPKVEAEDGTVTVRYSWGFRALKWRGHSGEVTLNAAVPWEVEMRGGASEIEADLGGVVLSSFVLKGGISDLDLTLPEPSGVVPIRLSGGASKVGIRRPAGVEARVSMKGGASKLTFDEQNLDAVGGKVRLQSPGYDGASDRYEIEVSGGASEVTIR